MKAALIGHSGFVGSNLKAAGGYTHFYNSQNIARIAGEQFERVTCAATPATKWLANAKPEEDWQSIQKLMDALATVKTARFELISTVDVFQVPVAVDEDSLVPTDGLQPYGAHRYAFEHFVQSLFPSACVLRLPALFGPGLKKNALYDLIHENCLEQVPMDGVFQWYNIARLPQDLERAQGLPLVHLVTEPLALRALVERHMPDKAGCGRAGKAARYDLRTRHAARFGGSGVYIADAATVLDEIGAYIAAELQRLRA